jgi:hypothetical protein
MADLLPKTNHGKADIPGYVNRQLYDFIPIQ